MANRGGKDIMNFYADIDIAGRSKDLTNLLKLPAYKDVDRDKLMVIGSFANGLNKNNPRENELYVGIMTGDLPTQSAIYEKVLSLYGNDVRIKRKQCNLSTKWCQL